MLKPNQILLTIEKDVIYIDDFRKRSGFKKFFLISSYLSNLIKHKYKELRKDVEYIPEFEVGSIVTLKLNPGGTLFKVRRNFDMYSVVEKIDRSPLEKACDMTFYIQRVSLVEYKEQKK